MTAKKNRPLGFGSCIGLVMAMSGCISGTMKPVNLNNELPGDLAKDLKERFEVKDLNPPPGVDPAVDPNAQAAQAAIPMPPDGAKLSSGSSPATGKTMKKGKGEKPRETAAVAPPSPPFVYPVRRPVKDPIWVSERLVYEIGYFGVAAGEFSLEVLPFKLIGNRKVYHIRGIAASSPVFSLFYRLNDVVESFIDYEGSFSHRFRLVLDESKQKRDSLELYDSEKKQTYYWNRWERKDAPYSETKEFAAIEPFSQDSLSALYYLRTVPLSVGAVVNVPVVSEGKSWEAVCTVLRKEPMETPIGKVQAFVIKPETKFQGVLQKRGDSFLWISDDDRRVPLRLEAKVKIGTVVANLRKMEPGQAPSASDKPPTTQVTTQAPRPPQSKSAQSKFN